MAYAPIALTIPQYDRTNLKNHWLKAYAQGTTTPIAIATDATGGTTASRIELDDQGFPITAGSARFIPFIDGDYDLWLFPTSSEADANDTANAIQLADNINSDPIGKLSGSGIDEGASLVYGAIQVVSAVAVLRTIAPNTSRNVRTLSAISDNIGGGDWYAVTGAAIGTYVHNIGTVVVMSGGDGSAAWLRLNAQYVNVLWFGGNGDWGGSTGTDNTAAFVAAYAYLGTNLTVKKTLHVPFGRYLFDTEGDITPGYNTFTKCELGTEFAINKQTTRFNFDYSLTLAGGTYPAVWLASNIGFEGVKIQGTGAAGTRLPDNLVRVTNMFGFRMIDVDLKNSKNDLYLENTDGLWTEFGTYTRCNFADSTKNIRVHKNGGTASFGHTRFRNCKSNAGEIVGASLGDERIFSFEGGASMYNSVFEFRTFLQEKNAGKPGVFAYWDASVSTNQVFELTVETFGGAGIIFSMNNSSTMKGAAGDILSISPEATFFDDTTNTIQADNKALSIRGPSWTIGGTEPNNHQNFSTNIVRSLLERQPADSQILHMHIPGALSGNDFVGLLPSEYNGNKEYLITKIEVGVVTASSGNPNSKWYFDVRNKFGTVGVASLGLTSLFITDASNQEAIIPVGGISIPDSYVNSGSPAVLVCEGTGGGLNTGTGPTDLWVVVNIAK